jgi:RHS repeat-associated protein
MYDKANGITVYFELDTIVNVRRLRGGHAVAPNVTEPPGDLGGYRYTAFGQLQPADDGTPYPSLGGQPYEQMLRWQGRPFINLAGGLYDFRARTWSPELGAFLELDSFGYLTPTGTLWSWPGQNPFGYRDPSGREGEVDPVRYSWVVAGAAAGGGVGFVIGGAGGTAAAASTGGLGAAAIPAGAWWGTGVGALVGGAAGGKLYDFLDAMAGAGDAFLDFMSRADAVNHPPYPGDDGSVSPGEEWEWRGKDPPGGRRGGWFKPGTGETLHPDLEHGPPHGPHWDWIDREGTGWRIFPDGRCEPK